ncbi:MAG: glycoside hydrolase family 44 protein [Anaerolineae bacterium]
MKKTHILLLVLFIFLCTVGVAGLGGATYLVYEFGDPSNGESGNGPVLYIPDVSRDLSAIPNLPVAETSLSPIPDFEALIQQHTDAGKFGLIVDVSRYSHEISPYIYGVNFSNAELLTELNIPLRRWGGNATTRYNWKTDVANRASDWFYLNTPNEVENVADLPNNSSADRFMGETLELGTQPILTVPLIGWTPRGREELCGFPVSAYGQQQYVNPFDSNCGNGISPEGQLLVGNDPNLTSEQIDPEFVVEWINHLTQQFGTAENGGIQFYNLDNEPMLWHETHRDVHPEYLGYADMRQRSIDYAKAVKQGDPSAKTLGPTLWGWTAYLYSARDIQDGSGVFENPDRDEFGDQPFVQWYLEQMKLYEDETGERLLDYFDLHYYSQVDNVSLTEVIDPTTQKLRLNATRSLWDPTYRDESWINKSIMLIPQMHAWIEESYPGTGTAITEYNFGALNHITGALVQADALGIFGRERLDLATLWDPPTLDQPGAFAFKMFRNYDGSYSEFGDLSLPAASLDQSRVSIYASRRQADNAITIMLINKSKVREPVLLELNGEPLQGKSYEQYRYSAVRPLEIESLAPSILEGNILDMTLESESIQLIVIYP